MILPTVNLLSVIVAAVASFVVGMVWHGPLFGKMWMKLSGVSQADADKANKNGGLAKTMTMGFVATLVIAYALAFFVRATNNSTLTQGLMIGFWAWLGFVVTTHANSVLWEMRSKDLYFFNMAYQLVNFLVIAGVVTVWV